jgi:hypothetical protein
MHEHTKVLIRVHSYTGVRLAISFRIECKASRRVNRNTTLLVGAAASYPRHYDNTIMSAMHERRPCEYDRVCERVIARTSRLTSLNGTQRRYTTEERRYTQCPIRRPLLAYSLRACAFLFENGRKLCAEPFVLRSRPAEWPLPL